MEDKSQSAKSDSNLLNKKHLSKQNLTLIEIYIPWPVLVRYKWVEPQYFQAQISDIMEFSLTQAQPLLILDSINI